MRRWPYRAVTGPQVRAAAAGQSAVPKETKIVWRVTGHGHLRVRGMNEGGDIAQISGPSAHSGGRLGWRQESRRQMERTTSTEGTDSEATCRSAPGSATRSITKAASVRLFTIVLRVLWYHPIRASNLFSSSGNQRPSSK